MRNWGLVALVAAVAVVPAACGEGQAAGLPSNGQPIAAPDERPAGQAVAAPRTGAIFNRPTGSAAQQYAIRNHIRGLLDRTRSGATVTMSLYNITDHERGFADAVVAAARRGVRVRVVLESEHAGTGAARAIVNGLGTNRAKPSWAVVCRRGCHGTNINHNKFYLFSSVEGRNNVVVQSSANLTISNARKYWNNAVTFTGNGALYNAYATYFKDLARNVDRPGYYKTFNAGNVKTYHFPRAGGSSSTDTIYKALGNVGCAGGGRIRVGMWSFSRTPVAERLASLARAGCTVDVVYSGMSNGVSRALRGKPRVHLRKLDRNGQIVHSKYMLVDAKYDGTRRWITFTGSANFTNPGLRKNDETVLRIFSKPIHDQYVANFTNVWRAAG